MSDSRIDIQRFDNLLGTIEATRREDQTANNATAFSTASDMAQTSLTPILPVLASLTGMPSSAIRELLMKALASLGTASETPWRDFRVLLEGAINASTPPVNRSPAATPFAPPVPASTTHNLHPNLLPAPHFVVLIHGIRTEAEWEEPVAAVLRRGGLTPVPLRYGAFSTLNFLLPIPTLRRRAIDKLEIAIRDIRLQHPTALVSVLAHSFGTYSLARLIRRDFTVRITRIVLAGAVVNRAFPWHQVSHKFQEIINDCGSKDPWPILAESSTWGYGASGTVGFGTFRVTDRFFPLGHSDLLTPEFAEKYWLPFLRDGQIVEGPEGRIKTPWLFSLLTVIKVKWVAIACIVVSLAWAPVAGRFKDTRFASQQVLPPTASVTPMVTPSLDRAIPATFPPGAVPPGTPITMKRAEYGQREFAVAFELEYGDAIAQVLFSPNGKYFCVAEENGTLTVYNETLARLWRRAGGEPCKFTTCKPSSRVAVSGDEKLLAVTSGSGVAVLDIKTGEQAAFVVTEGSATSVAFDSKGTWLAAGDTMNRVVIANRQTGQEVRSLRGSKGGAEKVVYVAFSDDGRSLAVTSKWDAVQVRVYATETWQLVKEVLAPSVVNSAQFSPGSKFMAVAGCNGLLDVYGTAGWAKVATPGDQPVCVEALAFGLKGAVLAAGGSAPYSVRVYDTASWGLRRVTKALTHAVTSISFDDKTERMAVGSSDKNVRIFRERE